jgi:hypothetical protein
MKRGRWIRGQPATLKQECVGSTMAHHPLRETTPPSAWGPVNGSQKSQRGRRGRSGTTPAAPWNSASGRALEAAAQGQAAGTQREQGEVAAGLGDGGHVFTISRIREGHAGGCRCAGVVEDQAVDFQ